MYPFLTRFITQKIIEVFFTPKGNLQDTTPIPSKTIDSVWSFVAMRYYALILNRTFRVYVTDQFLYGVRVGGSIASPMDEHLDKKWQNPEFYVNERLDRTYKEINVDILQKDKANFCILRSDILRVDYQPKKWGMGRVPYSGRLIITTRQNRKIELILLGDQNWEAIKKGIEK